MLRACSLLLILALALSGCSTSSSISAGPPPTAAPPTAVPAASEPSAPAPTIVPQRPAPTRPPAPTSLPEPTLAPTQAPAPTSAPATAAPTTVPSAPAPTAAPATAPGEEILFLRGQALWAYDLRTRGERRIVEDVADFVPGPGGRQIAILRGTGRASEIWLVARDGTNLRQVTLNDRAEASLAWSPDGTALIYAASASNQPFQRDWQRWADWCLQSEIRSFDLGNGKETSLAAGCDPAVSPDGRRIAYSAPPQAPEPGAPGNAPLTVNSVRLINRLGQNGWDFAKATGPNDEELGGRLVYGPSWSPDGAQVLYQRFIGYMALSDINVTEIGGSFKGQGVMLGVGGGWAEPAHFSPNSQIVALVSHDEGSAAGWTGYGTWGVELIRLSGSREVFLPSGSYQAVGKSVGSLDGGQQVAWSPDSSALVVQLPPNWQAGADFKQSSEVPGEVWLWRPGSDPTERLFAQVDYASPLFWVG